jgi:hypothetical protein
MTMSLPAGWHRDVGTAPFSGSLFQTLVGRRAEAVSQIGVLDGQAAAFVRMEPVQDYRFDAGAAQMNLIGAVGSCNRAARCASNAHAPA